MMLYDNMRHVSLLLLALLHKVLDSITVFVRDQYIHIDDQANRTTSNVSQASKFSKFIGVGDWEPVAEITRTIRRSNLARNKRGTAAERASRVVSSEYFTRPITLVKKPEAFSKTCYTQRVLQAFALTCPTQVASVQGMTMQ